MLPIFKNVWEAGMRKNSAGRGTPPENRHHEDEAASILARDVPADVVERAIRRHVHWSIGIGVVPLPLLDFAVITGIQINLLRVLAELYGLPFAQHAGRKFIASLLASVLPVVSAPTLAASVSKALPVMGQAAGVLTLPVLGGAATHALGKVFSMHFASGGTFLTFDPEQVRAYYADAFREGQRIALQWSDGVME